MFVIVSANEKSDMLATKCVCLAGIIKIESDIDEIIVTFDSKDRQNNADVELISNAIHYNVVYKQTIAFKREQVIAIMP